MRYLDIFQRSLSLLSTAQRKRYFFSATLQILTAILDIFGVIAFGLIVYITTKTQSDQESLESRSKLFEEMSNWLPDRTLSVYILGCLVVIFFILKSLISLALLKSIYFFLSETAVKITSDLSRRFFSGSLPSIQAKSSQQIFFGLSGGVNAAVPDTLGAMSVIMAESALILFLIIGLSTLDVFLSLLTLSYFLLISFFLQFTLAGRAEKTGLIRSETEVSTSSTIQQGIFTFREIYTAGLIGALVERIEEIRNRASRNYVNSQVINLIPKYALESALIVGGVLVSGIAFLTQDSRSALALTATFLAAGSRIVPSILRVQNSVISIKAAYGYSTYTFEIISEIEEFESQKHDYGKSSFRNISELSDIWFSPKVSLKNIWFSYPGSSQPALSDISFDIAEGEKVALVGGTGAGKTTLVDLILGILLQDRGEVLLNNLSPRESISNWPGQVGYVPQHTSLFNGTIAENIALLIDDEEIDEIKVWRALEIANLKSHVELLPKILQTEIGENGMKLSGGQRQRLGLARALYSDPKLLILDEATSSLDANTENLITEALDRLSESTTTITIAHRLSTVKGADRIFYLENGKLIASGNFDSLRREVPDFDRQARLSGL